MLFQVAIRAHPVYRVKIRMTGIYGMCRLLHSTSVAHLNPILPFGELLEELTSEEDEDGKEKKKGDKKKGKVVTKNVKANQLHQLNYHQKNVYQLGGGSGSGGEPPIEPPKNNGNPEPEEEKELGSRWERFRDKFESFSKFVLKCVETIGITFSSLFILGLCGYSYHKFYNIHVIDKIASAFEDGTYDQIRKTKEKIESSHAGKYWVERPQQKLIDDIVSGKISGRYFLLLGEKGTGKTSMLVDAIRKVDGKNVVIFDAHADPEIFRLRLGKAIRFAYNEDYIGSLFSIRGPRDTTALLDIERAFSQIEEMATSRFGLQFHRPLVIIINNSHLIKDNEDGIKLIELLQQKAENLSASGSVNLIFNSDDYWVYEKLKKLGTRLELINVRDFNRKQTVSALKYIRHKFYPEEDILGDSMCNQIYNLIGGRPQHVSQVCRYRDVIQACHELIDREKTWFLNQCGLLGSSMDDDVMESGKFSTSAMLLMKEFVEMDQGNKDSIINTNNTIKDHKLPDLPLWRSRQVMTRNDYIQEYDNLNIFTIDSLSRVKPDSVPMMRAFHEIHSQPYFNELLEETTQRVADIEALNRTREILFKDLNLGSKFEIIKKPNGTTVIDVIKSERHIDIHGTGKEQDQLEEDEEDIDDNTLAQLEGISRHEYRNWWKRRMGAASSIADKEKESEKESKKR
ncbi:uncharacterized protein KQ657_005032 [Scheffersomyces spartinae]|uniref:AAA protein C-terminal winged helix domain-containing protein n=1 Tax=Scheffersomyces spartinae TaxID=45513 RepID=A0A9P7VAI2_9ASCO|nr:uncharacterized protein KQ657_005032 [Scheffersomyces spartinae]KAG7194302.1 hypothetical protein KQ657_005032 [Scheffersomyces spartinae]